MSTVLYDKRVKEALLNDIAGFLNRSMQEWYVEHGIPGRQGLLLYRPPGTGKSSLSFSIAGHFGIDVYVMILASIDDRALNSLFAKLPQHCVVLLEDTDAAT
jgi:chaperone BCS1